MIPTNPIPEVPNYGSSAIYRELPSEEQIRAGVIPLDSLPAAWWNAMWACTNTAVNDARSAVGTLITEVCNAITGAGICINESCVDQLYQAIETIRQRVGNAVTAGAVKSSPNCGEVSIDANGIMTANGVGNAALLNTTSKVVVSAINELKSTYDCCLSDLNSCIGGVDNSKAPTNHASSATTYGVGNADCYGHVKISDTYDSCVGAAADGIAASQLAVYCVYQAVQSAAGLGNTAGCALGTASAGTCNSAARSDHVHPIPSCVMDKYGSSTIGIGYACAGLTCAQLANLAAFSTSYTSGCTVIKDVSKATVQCWLGLGGAAYCAAGCFRASTWTPSCVACAGHDGSGCAFGTAARYPDGRYAFAANGNQNCVSYAGSATCAGSLIASVFNSAIPAGSKTCCINGLQMCMVSASLSGTLYIQKNYFTDTPIMVWARQAGNGGVGNINCLMTLKPGETSTLTLTCWNSSNTTCRVIKIWKI